MNNAALPDMEREIAPVSDAWKSPKKPLIERIRIRRGATSEFVQVFVAEMEARGIRHTAATELVTEEYLRRAMVLERNNQCAAARRLGVHRNTVNRMLKRVAQ